MPPWTFSPRKKKKDIKKKKSKKKSENESSSTQSTKPRKSPYSSNSAESTDYDTAAYENVELNDMQQLLNAINMADIKTVKQFWKQVKPDLRKELIKSDIDRLSEDEETKRQNAAKLQEHLSDLEEMNTDYINLLTLSSYDAGEQYNTIADRRELQEKQREKIEEKKKLKSAQKLLEKNPLSSSTQAKVNKLIQETVSESKNVNNTDDITSIVKNVVKDIVKQELKGIKPHQSQSQAAGHYSSDPDSSSSSSSSSTDAKKSPAKKKRERKRGKKLKRPKSDDSLFSHSSSLFEKDPVKLLIFKMEKTYKEAQVILSQHKNDLKLLEMSQKSLEAAIENFYNSTQTLPNCSPQAEELLSNLAQDLEKAKFETVQQLSKVYQILESRRTGPKPTFPQFNGDALQYHSFQREIDGHIGNLPVDQQITQYKRCIVGPDKESILSDLANLDSYKKVVQAMVRRYGSLDNLLRSQIEKINNLPKTPSNRHIENENISTILKFIRWLDANGQLGSIFNKSMILTSICKLRQANQDYWESSDQPNDLDSFQVFINRVQTKNYGVLMGSRYEKGKDDKPKIKPDGSTGSRAASVTDNELSKPPCGMCGQNHWTNKCPSLQNINSVDQMKKILKERNICFSCVMPNTAEHKKICKETYRKNGTDISKFCRCNSGISRTICPCKRRNSGKPATAPRVLLPAQVMNPAPAPAPAHQTASPLVPAPQGYAASPQQPSGPPPTLPSTASRTVRTNQHSIMINGIKMGDTKCLTQELDMVSPKGVVIRVLCLWDEGSDHTLISNGLRDYFWESTPITYTLNECTTTSTVNGHVAKLCILNNNTPFYFDALSQALSTNVNDSTDFDVPHEWQSQYKLPPVLSTPAGKYSIIIGRDLGEIQPIEIKRHNKLRLYGSFFNNEFLIAGPKGGSTSCLSNYINVHRASIQVHYKEVPETLNGIKKSTKDLNVHKASIDKDEDQEQDLAVLKKVCQTCRTHHCTDCEKFILKSPTVVYEESVLEKAVHFIEHDPPQEPGIIGHFEVRGVYNQKLPDVPMLKKEVTDFQLHLEKKLSKLPEIKEQFNQSIIKRQENGNWAEYSKIAEQYPEINGVKHVYSPMNYTLKENSVNTKCRPVQNASFAPNPQKPTLNNAMFKGSSLNDPIQYIILRMRQWPVMGSSDIDNFYQSLRLSVKDMGLNLMIYRHGGWTNGGDLKTLVSLVLTYGQTHSQFLANLAKLLASKMFILEISPEADFFIRKSLTDDIFIGGKDVEDLKRLSKIITEGLKKASFHLKPWVFSGDETTSKSIGDNEVGCLGLLWDCYADTWSLNVNLNVSPKSRGLRNKTFQISNMEEARNLFSSYGITKRACLRLAHSIYDPNGLFLQVKTNLSLLYRHLLIVCPDLKWDDNIPESLHKDWLSVIEMILNVKHIKVPRFCLKGINPQEMKVDMGIFCDGSDSASCSRIFFRYKNESNGTYAASYVTGSSRLAQKGQGCAPKTECESVLIGLRLMQTVLELFTDIEIQSISLFSDSKISLGGLVSNSITQKLYFSLRNTESRSIIQKHKVKLYYVESSKNDADLASKLQLKVNHAATSVYWQSSWFFLDPDEWPAEKYEFSQQDIQLIENPKLSVLNVHRIGIREENLLDILSKHRSFQKLNLIFAYLFLWLKRISQFQQATEQAKYFLIGLAPVTQAEATGVGRQFNLESKENITYVIPRQQKMHGEIVKEKLILLSTKSEIAKKLLNDFHIHNADSQYEIAKMFQNGYYIIGARSYFKRLNRQCFTCIKIRKASVEALMGPSIQAQAAKNVPAMSICFMDILGPFKIKHSKNIVKKIYILCITCVWTRYCNFLVLEDYTSNSVLQAILTGSYILGGSLPHVIYCDSGSNFLPLQRLQDDETDETEKEKSVNTFRNLKRTLQRHNIVLKPSTPRSSWRNSLAESMVKLFKACLKRSNLQSKTFTMPQWQYIVSKITFLVNSRPLNVRFIGDSLSVLTPISLVFGTRKAVYPQDLDLNDSDINLYEKVKRIDNQLLAFSNIWQTSYALQLKKWTKFKTKSKPLKKGDIVFVLDKINSETKQPTLGIIVEAKSERTYSVEYSKRKMKINSKTFEVTSTDRKNVIDRPSQQLALIVSPESGVKEIDVNVDAFTPHYEDLLQDQSILPITATGDELFDEFHTEATGGSNLVVDYPRQIPLIADIN